MAASPVSGALSPTQLAALQQIRALRATRPPAAAPMLQAASARPSPAPAKPADLPVIHRGRGSIINIIV